MTDKPGRDEILKRLREHTKQRSHEIEGQEIGTRVSGETDRGAVIILASMVEDALETKIKGKMVKLNSDEAARLFGPEAPIGTFSAKIRLAQALGIVDRDIRKACDIIREMRNACAHSRNALSFKDDVLLDALRLLEDIAVADDNRAEHKTRQFTKYMFGYLVGYVFNSILFDRDKAAIALNRMMADLTEEVRALAAQGTSPDKPQ